MTKPWAVVTGASGGLGDALARDIARRGYHVVLAARGEAAMQRLAAELRGRHDVEVAVEAIDLGVAGSAAELCERLARGGVEPDILINNAAFGIGGEFLEADPARLRQMLQLNIVTLTELTQQIGRQMQKRGGGKILLVGSVGAYSSSPLIAAYAATKAYVLSLGEALHVEMAPVVQVSVLTPGIMETGFGTAAGFHSSGRLLRASMLPTSEVARKGLDALFAGRSNVVVGGANKVIVWSSRLMSRAFGAKAFYRMAQGATARPKGAGGT